MAKDKQKAEKRQKKAEAKAAKAAAKAAVEQQPKPKPPKPAKPVKGPAHARVLLTLLPHAEGLALPAYETPLSAGMDVRAAVPEDEPVTLKPGERYLTPTGLAIALPAGFEAQMRPRSGLAIKHGITCLNSPGTIDADYRGELKVILVNLGQEPFTIARGERIAQIVIAPVTQGVWKQVDALPETRRGKGGFGSTGRK